MIEAFMDRLKVEGTPQDAETAAKHALHTILSTQDDMLRNPVKRMIAEVMPIIINHVKLRTEVGKAILDMFKHMQNPEDPIYDNVTAMEAAAAQMVIGSMVEAMESK